MFIGSVTLNSSEVLKLNLNSEIHLRLLLNSMNSRQKLELISSVDCSYSGIFLIKYFSVYCNPVLQNTTSAGKDLMLVMVFSSQ